MRDVCQIDVIVGARHKLVPAGVAAAELFVAFKNCRVLSSKFEGPRLRIELLLPELRGGYGNCAPLKGFVEEGLLGKGVVVVAAYVIREATTDEVLGRVIARRSGTK